MKRVRVHDRLERAFTLVELLIVVVILALLSAMAIPAVSTQRQDAILSVLQANVSRIRMMIEFQRQSSADPTVWPSTLDPTWFSHKSMPHHPLLQPGVPPLQVLSSGAPSEFHPRYKLVAGSPGGYWYNPENGAFCARIKDMGSDAATLEAYNIVNASKLLAIGDTQ